MSEDMSVAAGDQPERDRTEPSARDAGDRAEVEAAGTVQEAASHPHVWDRITEVCTVTGCGRQKPAWLVESETEGTLSTVKSAASGRWASLPRPVRWLLVGSGIALMLALAGSSLRSLVGASVPAKGGGGQTVYMPGVIVDSPQPGETVTITNPE